MAMALAQAELKLALLNARTESTSNSDLYIWLCDRGLSSEVAIRLMTLMEVTRDVGGSLINIGKIVVFKIVEFIKAHPNLAIGVAVGAAVGALVGAIPFLGVYLAPIVTVISVTIGGVIGHRMDKGVDVSSDGGIFDIGKDLIEIAKEFFVLIIDIFNLVFKNIV